MAIEKEVDEFIKESDVDTMGNPIPSETEQGYAPQYRVLANDKIPISKRHGKVWKARRDAAFGRLKSNNEIDRWDDAIRYYRNDHASRQRNSGDDVDKRRSVNLTTKGLETENIVFANTSALVPAIHAKNPSIEISVIDKSLEDWAVAAESSLTLS